VEIEEKFYKWMEKARENAEKATTLTQKGWIKNICGDARKLSELLSQVDAVITSPPYSDSAIQDYGTSNKALLEFERQVRESFRKLGYFEYKGKRYTEEEWRRINKGELKPRGMPELWAEIVRQRDEIRYNSGNPENIGNMPLGDVDVIITSPPYSDSISRQGGDAKVVRVGTSTLTAREYSSNPENIGNLPIGNVDVIITSPPYADSRKHDHRAEKPEALKKMADMLSIRSGDHHTPGRMRRIMSDYMGYSESQNYIGNLPLGSPNNLNDREYEILVRKLMKDGKPTYLSEMLKVYRECYKVLKPNGLAIVVVKPFIRNKRVIDLPYYTYLLMSRCGFKLERLYKLRLQNLSFWRILYQKKFPNVPRIAHEYVVVARKPSEGGE